MSANALADAMTRQRVDERERALRALLMRPLATPADPEFVTIRRHAEFLRSWLARETGWILRVERDCARLYKRPADLTDETRGMPEFDRRHYVVFCLLCAILERAEPQITLRALGERLIELAASPELAERGFRFTLEQAQERRELVRVCRVLLGLGVLHRVAGEEESYVQHGGDALYDLHRRVLAGLLACVRGPSTFAPGSEPSVLSERLAMLTDEYLTEGPESQHAVVRHRIARRMLDDPVVYVDELSCEERDYLANQRGVMAARLRAATALRPELRAEGVAMVDPEGELSDAALPAEGTVAHATLLVAEFLAEKSRSEPGCIIPDSAVAAFLREKIDEYGRYWRKAMREPGAEAELAEEAVRRLVALKLVLRDERGVLARPALGRFALAQPDVRPASLLASPS